MYLADPSSSTVFNKFTNQLVYEPITSSTSSSSPLSQQPSIAAIGARSLSLDHGYQQQCSYRKEHLSNITASVTNEEIFWLKSCNEMQKSNQNSWLPSLQNFTLNLVDVFDTDLSMSRSKTYSEFEPIAGIDSESLENLDP